MPKKKLADVQERLAQAQPPAWITEMVAYQRKTGEFRPADVRRLLGDPTKSVFISGPAVLQTIFQELKEELQRREKESG